MVTVTFYKRRKNIVGFKGEGHSELKRRKDQKDYICSAISAVMYMAVIGLGEVLKKKIEYKEGESGFLLCKLKEEGSEETEVIFETLIKTLEKIEREYKGNIKINYKEVD